MSCRVGSPSARACSWSVAIRIEYCTPPFLDLVFLVNTRSKLRDGRTMSDFELAPPTGDLEESTPSAALAFGTVLLGGLGIVALLVALLVGAGKSDGGASLAANGAPRTIEVALAEFAVT